MRSERFEFPGAQGHALAARLDLPAGRPKAYALFAHCFTCTKDIFAAARVAAGLTGHGIAVLRFDFTGLGHSQGEFANTNFSSNVGDLIAAADHLRRTQSPPQILVGHSLGGAAVLAAAEAVPEARAVATIGAPFDPAHVAHHFKDKLEEIDEKGEAEVAIAGRPFQVQKQFLDDLQGQKQAERIGALKRALLVFHAPTDATVGIENASQIFSAAKHPKSFVSLDDADHLLTRRRDADYVATVLTAWASRFVETAPDPENVRFSDPSMLVVQETGAGKFQHKVLAGQHRFLADEPLSVGGDDSGPNPYDLLLAALGACTGMTLRLYAERKGLALDRVAVGLTHDRIHAEDCEACETQEGMVDRIRRSIRLDGRLDDTDRAKLMEIADKCPVHRLLTSSEVIVDTAEQPAD